MAKGFLYKAGIEHTEKTIEALYKMQYYTYEKPRILIQMGIGLVLIFVAAFSAFPTWAKGILLLIGAWLVVSLDFPGSIRADQAMEARHGKVPGMQYEFYPDNMKISGEGSMTSPYKKIARLAQENAYLYIFFAKDSVCMIDKSTIQPEDVDGFMKFLTDKTGLEWRREHSLLMLNFWDIRDMMKDRKNK